MGKYFSGLGQDSAYIEDHYIDASKVNLSFPEKKRNLIYIYLESMELAYTDQANGGIYEVNTIPELTELTKENENFSGNSDMPNGGIALTGSTFTSGAMVSMTSGLPLKSDVEIARLKEIYPTVTTLGDILKQNGYTNELMIGSDAEFGGRGLYFREHGNYELNDYYAAIEDSRIPQDYHVWWGYEDHKLFEFAKDELKNLSSQEEPFNLTLLTVDTHFENGYVCDQCENDFDDQYRNVIHCSDRQVSEFVTWVQQQDFYENTTIILSGDHPSMDAAMCSQIPSDYERKVYTCVINAAAEPVDPARTRTFSTLDMFPTTLAAMGVTIEGDRLGLGVNLFSDEDTMLEESGVEYVDGEMNKSMEFLNTFGYDQGDTLVDPTKIAFRSYYNEFNNELIINGNVDEDLLASWNAVSVKVSDDQGNEQNAEMQQNEDALLIGKINLAELNGELTIDLSAVTAEGKIIPIRTVRKSREVLKAEREFTDYMDYLESLDNITIMAISRGDNSVGITDEIAVRLDEIGLNSEYLRTSGYCYAAIIENDHKTECFQESEIEHSDTLASGKRVYLHSDWEWKFENCLIEVDDVEYSQDRNGLNFVICDSATGEVISTASFDFTFASEGEAQCYAYDEVQNTVGVALYDIGTESVKANGGFVKFTDTDHLDDWKIAPLQNYDGSDETVFGTLDLEDLNPTDMIMKLYYLGQDCTVYFGAEVQGDITVNE